MEASGGKILVRVDAEIKDLVPRFLENRRKDIQSMQAALERGDFETIRVLGHSMKGAGGGYGFDPISQIGRSLECFAKEADSGQIRKQMDDLSSYLDRVVIVYE